MSLLRVRDLEAYYGAGQVLFGVDLEIGKGEVVALLGRNGMGKTTTVRAVMNLGVTRSGVVELGGRDLLRLPSYRIARLGVGLVPEGRQVFPHLTVRENLVATAARRSNGASLWTLNRVYELFPVLGERSRQPGDRLSGGEQQMLAIGRALMTNPRLLILDEATEGLAPLVRKEIWKCIERLKKLGHSILVIDKNLDALLRVADRHVVLEKGRVVWRGSSRELASDPRVRAEHLGV